MNRPDRVTQPSSRAVRCFLGTAVVAVTSLNLAVAVVAEASPGAIVAQERVPAAKVQRTAALRVGRTPGRTRIVVDLSGEAQYRVFGLEDPWRVVIDLQDTRLQGQVPPGLFGKTPVLRLRSGTRNDGDLRLVLDLAHAGIRREDFSLRPDAHGGHRLVVDLYEERQPPLAEGQADIAGTTESTAAPGGLAPASVPEVLSDVPGAGFAKSAAAAGQAAGGSEIWTGGYGEMGAAYTTTGNSHWSQLRARFEFGASGGLDWGGRFRLVARAEADGAYRLEDDFYPDTVRRNQESDLNLREAYLDLTAGEWEYRLGRQQVVWGEMVGLFLADVVSARDTREFYLPEFETMRIPQWAVRAERFAGDQHFELLWVPYATYDEIGKPGADFYPFQLPAGTPVNEVTPSRSKLANTAYGARYSLLYSGWDLTAFYYASNDVNPMLYRTDSGLQLRHDRIEQLGTTFSKDYTGFVLKGEAVYTSGRAFLSTDPAARSGVDETDSLEYILGVMLPKGDWRFDIQLYGRHAFQHDRGLLFDEDEFGATLLVNRRFGDRIEAEVLYLTGLNRSDYSVQPSVSWNITQTWRLQFGADLFGGNRLGFYGRYDDSDRVFLALKKWY